MGLATCRHIFRVLNRLWMNVTFLGVRWLLQFHAAALDDVQTMFFSGGWNHVKGPPDARPARADGDVNVEDMTAPGRSGNCVCGKCSAGTDGATRITFAAAASEEITEFPPLEFDGGFGGGITDRDMSGYRARAATYTEMATETYSQFKDLNRLAKEDEASVDFMDKWQAHHESGLELLRQAEIDLRTRLVADQMAGAAGQSVGEPAGVEPAAAAIAGSWLGKGRLVPTEGFNKSDPQGRSKFNFECRGPE
jgi:hypothetical protein